MLNSIQKVFFIANSFCFLKIHKETTLVKHFKNFNTIYFAI